ncbi:MAG: ROK family protein [Clostridia bacterium]|nr:ROK family protein [Clostridia bacterium]
MRILGIDIGGTKCAVVLGDATGTLLKKEQFPTEDCSRTIGQLIEIARRMAPFDAIGISCGGPLDAQRGVILSPPNLPGWDHVEIVRLLNEAFHVPVYLKNDADACALAEWRFGAGRGAQSLIFLTFGTGLGAGLILNGRLYSGASGLAGEVGHIRLADFGPVGYGKAGSFEGFCSGGGLAQLGQAAAKAHAQTGTPVSFAGEEITAKTVAAAAAAGDAAATEVFRQCGRMLGRGLSVLIDLLNPERIILGSIFARCEDLLRPEMEKEIEKETLPAARHACTILPAALGESIGDVGALCAAICGEAEQRKEPEA